MKLCLLVSIGIDDWMKMKVIPIRVMMSAMTEYIKIITVNSFTLKISSRYFF